MITMIDINCIEGRGIYEDLMLEFARNGHHLYVVSPTERHKKESTHIIRQKNCRILKVRTGNVRKTSNAIEKGIATVLLERQFLRAIQRYFRNVKFDLVIYSTPPITLVGAVEYVKKRDKAKTYLLLKDIFPQNAVDIGMLQKTGAKGILYRYFRKKEKKLYELSDYIGCMSQANVEYVLAHNPEIAQDKVEICPNAIKVCKKIITDEEKKKIRRKYRIPQSKKIFVYGGNLGKPQGMDFVIQVIRKCQDIEDAFFLIVGDGTEYERIKAFMENEKPVNAKLLKRLPIDEYDTMIAACDVGLIFLDHRFTIPNFPSRLLAYMQARLPILAATDPNTDIGKIITDGEFGWWCESNHPAAFRKTICEALASDRKTMGNKAFEYLCQYYTAERCYEIIIKNTQRA